MKHAQTERAVNEVSKSKTGAANEDLPAGDMPPQPAWPLVVGVAVWVLWLGFLAAMMVIRMQTTAV